MKPTIENAIEILKRRYEDAKKQEWIKLPLSYAIYYTWKEIEMEEKKCNTHGDR